ncbi:class I SAM-dependent methyltransferase [Flocculibacter collagenilyticus]|uniref:class I SAM-dependent methyltransferase n=1 Tax=Flocculibacter collagenilyticus TaxID=2744479 RepID=UPI0018F2F5B7|nr:class I SAM-dependent methyltransferase [Flocculibacter collagenilyticus]
MQKEIFLASEGDAWYQRNKASFEKLADDQDLIAEFIAAQEISPEHVLEIGCSDGRRLSIFNKKFNTTCSGIDVSTEAINAGKVNYPTIDLQVGSADKLAFNDEQFDLVIIGFCLYLCDRKDLFRIAAEVDRVLKDGGYVVIQDFHTPFAYKNKYSHCDNIYSYKMDYSKLFSWNPAYTLLSSNITSHSGLALRVQPDERISINLLYKSIENAYPDKPAF